MTGIDDVARAAGVSTATVSRALSGRGVVSAATREKVLAVAGELGYVVSVAASSLASGRAQSIGVLVPLPDLWFFSTVVSAISGRLLPHGYDITLFNLTENPAERRVLFDRSLRRGRIDGLIVLSAWLSAAEQAELAALDVPVVGIGPSPALPTLVVDDVAVGRAATAHLLALGHRDIAHIGQSDGDDFHIPTLRRRGWEQALTDAGIAPRDDLYAAGDFTLEGGRAAARRLLTGPAPTAIFAASDEMAVGALVAARDLGLAVPGDVSIVGVDGHELSRFFDLSTVDQFPHAQGERVADAMLAALGELEAPAEVGLPFELVVRGSSAAPPA
ncbi:LacI family DNA-binding transcriptional regulator [Microbacterium fluvii]|uniref:LacI family DNA-binding transcriptional regulator n=1 Tax=Microbacterium fluvii TaxID=415215 RepID=A0ABW2HKZ3_9MICO|nr:LacI family DNA-binding transcriptional regulator [Microbacterium fluvii]MCU4673821.1 LacI family transcriptional regulator [Microbacterium fluvii]